MPGVWYDQFAQKGGQRWLTRSRRRKRRRRRRRRGRRRRARPRTSPEGAILEWTGISEGRRKASPIGGAFLAVAAAWALAACTHGQQGRRHYRDMAAASLSWGLLRPIGTERRRSHDNLARIWDEPPGIHTATRQQCGIMVCRMVHRRSFVESRSTCNLTFQHLTTSRADAQTPHHRVSHQRRHCSHQRIDAGL